MSLIPKTPSLKSLKPITASTSKRDKKPEDVLSHTLPEAIFGPRNSPLSSDLWKKYANFRALSSPSSDNWPLMAAATWLWHSPTTVLEEWTAIDWWIQFFRWQLGIERASDPTGMTSRTAPGDTGFFELSEPSSNNYGGMICGSVVSVFLWTFKTPPQSGTSSLRELSSLWLQKWTIFHSLFSIPGPFRGAFDLGVGHDKESQIDPPNKTINLPILTQTGSRSTPSHIISDPRQLILAELLDWKDRSHPWPARDPWDYWFLVLTRELEKIGQSPLPDDVHDLCISLDGPSGPYLDRYAEAVEQLSALRWKPTSRSPVCFSLSVFSSGAKLSVMPFPVNTNTAPILGSLVLSGNGAISISCWPWVNPKNPDMSSGQARIDGDKLIVSSAYGQCRPVDLPSSPVEIVVEFGEFGVKIS